MPSTLTAGGKDGKRWEKIERNPLYGLFGEILLLWSTVIFRLFAQGLNCAQSMMLASYSGGEAILKSWRPSRSR